MFLVALSYARFPPCVLLVNVFVLFVPLFVSQDDRDKLMPTAELVALSQMEGPPGLGFGLDELYRAVAIAMDMLEWKLRTIVTVHDFLPHFLRAGGMTGAQSELAFRIADAAVLESELSQEQPSVLGECMSEQNLSLLCLFALSLIHTRAFPYCFWFRSGLDRGFGAACCFARGLSERCHLGSHPGVLHPVEARRGLACRGEALQRQGSRERRKAVEPKRKRSVERAAQIHRGPCWRGLEALLRRRSRSLDESSQGPERGRQSEVSEASSGGGR